jgi:hypothetical protein
MKAGAFERHPGDAGDRDTSDHSDADQEVALEPDDAAPCRSGALSAN